MGTRMTSTTTVNVPVYAAWECSQCGEKIFSDGVFSFSASSSTRAFPTKKELERIKNDSKEYAEELWKKKALGVIINPIKNYGRFRESLHIYNSSCPKCGNKEKWNKGMGYMSIFALDFTPTIISLICLIANPSSLWAWFFFLIFGTIFGVCIYSEYHFKTILKNIPPKSMPVIGSLNPELKEYAKENNYNMLTPQEVLAQISTKEKIDEFHQKYSSLRKKEKKVSEKSIEIIKPQIVKKVNTLPETSSLDNHEEHHINEDDTINKCTDGIVDIMTNREAKSTEPNEEIAFCRKCGTQLLNDSEFCHKCGCEKVH